MRRGGGLRSERYVEPHRFKPVVALLLHLNAKVHRVTAVILLLPESVAFCLNVVARKIIWQLSYLR
jgi:hypothetical protein